MNNSNYWINKSERSAKAQEHSRKMEQEFYGSIIVSYNNSTIEDRNTVPVRLMEEVSGSATMFLKMEDSVTAIFNAPKIKRLGVLNFASFKNPGGMFLKGSSAQEESLCHSSTLYNILRRFDDSYYAYNRRNVNRSLYEDRAIYSPDVLFFNNDNGSIRYCDVITCAAPNKGAAMKYHGVSEEENIQALMSRIDFVFDIAKRKGITTLIIGAYGCGVFKQDAYDVAMIMKQAMNMYPLNYIIAIPKGINYDKFMEVFSADTDEF